MTTKQIDGGKTERWAAALRIGLAVAEGADVLDGADRIQILDAKGTVLFSAQVPGCRR